MDILGTFQLLNIINLLNTIFPKGIGEIIVLLCWLGFFALLSVMTIAWALTKEQIYTNTRCRITMEDEGIVVYPGGSTRETILPRKCEKVTMKMGEKDVTWTINPDEWMTKSNGVRYTYLHPDIPHNISLNTLVRTIKTAKTMKLDENDEVEFISVDNISFTAYDQDAKILTIAQAYAQDLTDPSKRLTTVAIAISLILAVGIAGAMLFIVMPHPAAEAVAQVTTTVTTITTTTIPGLSGLAPK